MQCNFQLDSCLNGNSLFNNLLLVFLNQPHLEISRISWIYLQDLSDMKGIGHSIEER